MSKSRQNAQRLVLKINSKKIRYANWDFKISLEDFDETDSTLKEINDEKIKILDIGQTFKI